MRLRNVLIVVNDIERSARFYRELFGLQVILNHMTELYFEEADLNDFVKKLEQSEFQIEYVNELMELNWGQKVVRFYDPDGNLIEVGTPIGK